MATHAVVAFEEQQIAELRKRPGRESVCTAGVDVFDQRCAGVGSIGPPQLVAMRSIVGPKIHMTPEHREARIGRRTKGRCRSRCNVLHARRPGKTSVTRPKLSSAAAR